MPLKAISFDMPAEYSNIAWIFEDKHFTAVPHGEDLVRVYGFGDLIGLDYSFDKRRTRNLLNVVAKTMDTSQAMSKSNLKPVMTALSPDDLPIVGCLKHHGNVYLNVGHNVKASTLAFSSG